MNLNWEINKNFKFLLSLVYIYGSYIDIFCKFCNRIARNVIGSLDKKSNNVKSYTRNSTKTIWIFGKLCLIYPPIFFYFSWAIWRYRNIYFKIMILVIQKPPRICYLSRWLCIKLDSTKSVMPVCHWYLKKPLIFLISVFDKFLFYAG